MLDLELGQVTLWYVEDGNFMSWGFVDFANKRRYKSVTDNWEGAGFRITIY